MPASTRRRTARHAFILETPTQDGPAIERKFFTKVKTPRSNVTLTLKEADVQRSIDAGGIGNTMTCSMAMCVNRLRSQFPHPVPTHAFIDWQYKTAFVVSKVDRHTNLPTECYRYVHNGSSIARLNDDPSGSGQRRLLRMVQEAGGSIEITLRPRIRHDVTPLGGTGRRTGSRSTVIRRDTGPHARRAYASLGLLPIQPAR